MSSDGSHQHAMLRAIDGALMQSEADVAARRKKQAQFGANQYFDPNTAPHTAHFNASSCGLQSFEEAGDIFSELLYEGGTARQLRDTDLCGCIHACSPWPNDDAAR